MLRAIFYARFHPERGPDVLHQWPPKSITRPTTTTTTEESPGTAAVAAERTADDQVLDPLISFSDISAYIIPPHDLCNRSLSICTNGFRVLGWPVSLEDEVLYARNRFVCNVCFVLREEEEDVAAWEQVVAKMARFVRSLELEEGRLVSHEEKDLDLGISKKEDGAVVERLLRETFAQLGAFGECCVRINEAQVLNLRLDKATAEPGAAKRPPKIRAWEVPLFIRELPSPEAWTHDLVLEMILPHVDGVNHVQKIASRADVDIKLVKMALRELVQHQRVMMLDLFHFRAVYTLTPDFVWFIKDRHMLTECNNYVATDPKESIFTNVEGMQNRVAEAEGTKPTASTVIELYSSLKFGISVADLCLANQGRILNIDIRRLITFGVIKGFLRRQHKYALALDPASLPAPTEKPTPTTISKTPTPADVDKAWRKAALSSGWATPPADIPPEMLKDERPEPVEARLVRFLNGKHCLDQICVELGLTENAVLEKLRSGVFGEVVVFCR